MGGRKSGSVEQIVRAVRDVGRRRGPVGLIWPHRDLIWPHLRHAGDLLRRSDLAPPRRLARLLAAFAKGRSGEEALGNLDLMHGPPGLPRQRPAHLAPG